MWIETVPEGVRRYMVAWRKKQIDAARHRERKRDATKLGKLLSFNEAQNLRSDVGWSYRRTEKNLYGRETNRDLSSAYMQHVDASRDALLATCSFCSLSCIRALCLFFLFSRNEHCVRWGWKGSHTFYFVIFSLFSRPRVVGLAMV